ncbi:MAG TPA: hypothetical protein DCE08_07050 [Ruminococcaceae bacterium]|nr:hypothetical protein [Oscillospiraceae bacterium]
MENVFFSQNRTELVKTFVVTGADFGNGKVFVCNVGVEQVKQKNHPFFLMIPKKENDVKRKNQIFSHKKRVQKNGKLCDNIRKKRRCEQNGIKNRIRARKSVF